MGLGVAIPLPGDLRIVDCESGSPGHNQPALHVTIPGKFSEAFRSGRTANTVGSVLWFQRGSSTYKQALVYGC